MFIWDFIADTVLGQIIDWIYGQIVGFLGDFFMQMGNMGADLFEMGWVQSIVLFSLTWHGRCTPPGWWWQCSSAGSNARAGAAASGRRR